MPTIQADKLNQHYNSRSGNSGCSCCTAWRTACHTICATNGGPRGCGHAASWGKGAHTWLPGHV